MKKGEAWFVGYPSAVQYAEKGTASSAKGKKAINQLLWGDWARISAIEGNWVQVRARRRTGWVHKDNLQKNRILEVNFVDVGQGDGCHIQTPDDKSLIVDAGVEDNMYRFLRWRFGRFQSPYNFEAMIISHPDKDHYYGFRDFFGNPNISADAVYHNGIVEQVSAGKNSLGAVSKHYGKSYLSGLVLTMADLEKITKSKIRRGGRLYPNMMKSAVDGGRVSDIAGLLAGTDWKTPVYVPGFAPADNRGMTLKVLGPVPNELKPGKLGLRKFGSVGKTKNGHSVVLLLEIGDISVLLGGDLNEPSQEHLLAHYTGLDPSPGDLAAEETLVEEARKVFEVDVAKACHHGSADVLPVFLRSTNPIATIVSSGDDEPHAHPRPDTLGMIGKFGRGSRPLIFSTELARSSKETIKHPNQVRAELKKSILKDTAVMHDPAASQQEIDAAAKSLEKSLQVIERSVASYGMINLRTDGKRMIIAQRLEKKRSSSVRWDLHRFSPDARGRLVYQTK